MNQQIFVIAVAIVAVVLSTVLAMMAQRRELEPGKKRLLWLTLAVGFVGGCGEGGSVDDKCVDVFRSIGEIRQVGTASVEDMNDIAARGRNCSGFRREAASLAVDLVLREQMAQATALATALPEGSRESDLFREFLSWRQSSRDQAIHSASRVKVIEFADGDKLWRLANNLAALMLISDGMYEEGNVYVFRVLDLGANDVFALRLATFSKFRTGHVGEAAQYGARAINIEPRLDRDVIFMVSYAWSVALAGDPGSASDILNNLLVAEPLAVSEDVVIKLKDYLDDETRGH